MNTEDKTRAMTSGVKTKDINDTAAKRLRKKNGGVNSVAAMLSGVKNKTNGEENA